MNSEPEPGSVPQATVWPPPPTNLPIEPAADPLESQLRPILRALNKGIFLFVAGILIPAGLIWLGAVLQWSYPFEMYILGCLCAGFLLAAIHFCLRSAQLAAQAHLVGIGIQSVLMTVMSIFFLVILVYILLVSLIY